MKSNLNITSRLDIEDIITYFSADKIDYVYFNSSHSQGGGGLRFTSIHFADKVSSSQAAETIGDYIIEKYESVVLNNVLKQSFMPLSKSESMEILADAQKSIKVFNQIYNRIIIVKNLTKYIENSEYISIEGFLNFRVGEYRRIVQLVLTDAIERFFIKEEYNEFLDMLRQYIKKSPSQIDLIHIKPCNDGSFLLYNYKKERIVFDFAEINSTEDFLTSQDTLMSILISLVPKRIIWHKTQDTNNNFENIMLTVENIFENRFCICKGCELCEM